MLQPIESKNLLEQSATAIPTIKQPSLKPESTSYTEQITENGETNNAQQISDVFEEDEPSLVEAVEEPIKDLMEVARDTLEKYSYQNLLYPVSQVKRLPENYPSKEAELPLTIVDPETIQALLSGTEGAPVIAEIIRQPLNDMFAAARNEGENPYLRSGFRSIATQDVLFNQNVERAMAEKGLNREQATELVNRESSRGGYSEHHTGLAIDVLDKNLPGYVPGDQSGWELARQNYQQGLYGWLRGNAHEYGFVVSYPTGLDQYSEAW